MIKPWILTGDENDSVEQIEDFGLACYIEETCATGKDGETWMRYTLEFEAMRNPDNDGSCRVKRGIVQASWPPEEPSWKGIIRAIFNLPT